MQCLNTAKIRAVLILPVLLLMVQFGIATPHVNSIKSWHDGDDSTQHLSADGFLEACSEAGSETNRHEYTPSSPAIPASLLHWIVPFITAHCRPELTFPPFVRYG